MNGIMRVAVVGHTNTGKTSLLRTLARDRAFGDVTDRAGTTRHVEEIQLLADGQAAIQLFDTPGIEDSIGLLEFLDSIRQGRRSEGPELIDRFLASQEAHGRFEQEAKVLRQLLASDAGFYVVDARDPVLPKFLDELEILSSCAKPLLPVLNFVAAQDSHEQAWREAMARRGLHAVVAFDTVAPALDSERRLFDALTTLMYGHREMLERLIEARALETHERRAAALRLVAELLVTIAATRLILADDSEVGLERAVLELYDQVRMKEQACIDALLDLYQFDANDVRMHSLPLLEGRWEHDLFSPETLRRMGMSATSAAAAGAAAGLGIDLLVGGITLGAAAGIGALAGMAADTVGRYWNRLVSKARGYRELTVNDTVLRLLVLRQRMLLKALENRGHAAIEPVGIADPEEKRWREGDLPQALVRARSHTEWTDEDDSGPDRERAIMEIVQSLVQLP